MSIIVVGLAIAARFATPTEKLTAISLGYWCNDDGGDLFPSMELIAKRVGVSSSQARRIVRRFVEMGLLSVVANAAGGKPGVTPRYQFHLDRLAALAPTDCTDARGRTDARGGMEARGRTDAQEGSHGCAGGLAPMRETPCTGASLKVTKGHEEVKEPSGARLPTRARVREQASPVDGFELPDWIPADAWDDYVDMRKAIKKPLRTAGGMRASVKTLDRLRAGGSDPRAVLEQSTAASWQGLFEVKGERKTGAAQRSDFHGKDYGGGYLESFAERDSRLSRERYEEAVGIRRPAPPIDADVIDVTPPPALPF